MPIAWQKQKYNLYSGKGADAFSSKEIIFKNKDISN